MGRPLFRSGRHTADMTIKTPNVYRDHRKYTSIVPASGFNQEQGVAFPQGKTFPMISMIL